MRFIGKRLSSFMVMIIVFSMMLSNVAYAADTFYDGDEVSIENITDGEEESEDVVLSDDDCVALVDETVSDNGIDSETGDAADQQDVYASEQYDSADSNVVTESVRLDEADIDDSILLDSFTYDIPSEVFTFDDTYPDNDELFASYVDAQLGDVLFTEQSANTVTTPATYGVFDIGSKLTGQDEWLYNKLVVKIKAIASGEDSSATLTIPTSELGLKTTYTTSDKDSSGKPFYNSTKGEWDYTAINDEIRSKIKFDTISITQALMADYPYECFWLDKTLGVEYSGISYSMWIYSNKIVIVYNNDYNVSMAVSTDYSASGNVKTYVTNSTKIASVQNVKSNAMAIVKKYSTMSDEDKLKAYGEEICRLTDYNYDAFEDKTTPYGDPWQLIYVFDNDVNTKVVCEGYSKAFKYLCDLSDFTYDDLWCITVTGTVKGDAHMWNIVHLSDGYNYLMDVCHADGGSSVNYACFFATPYSGSVASGYSFNMPYSGKIYTYDSFTMNLYYPEQLDLMNKMQSVVKPITKNGFTIQPSSDGTARVIECTLKGDVVIPETIDGYTIVGLNAKLFYGMSGITSVSIPKNVQAPGTFDYIFSYCYDLQEIKVDSANPFLCSIDGVLYSKDKNILYNYPVAKAETEFSTLTETTYLCCTSFASQKNLTGLYLTNKNTRWAGYTFYNTPNLKVYYLPDGSTINMVNSHTANGLSHEQNNLYPTFVESAPMLSNPVMTGVTTTATGLKVSWGAVSGAEKYRVFRKVGNGSWTKLVDVSSSVTSYTDTTVVNGTTYSYTVRCISSDGSKYTSNFDTTGKSLKYKNGLITESGVIYLYKAGVKATNYTGFYDDVSLGKCYIQKGVLNKSFTGVAKETTINKWIYVNNGIVDLKYTGIAHNPANGNTYYCKNGEVDWSCTSLMKEMSTGKWFYVIKGQVDYNYVGLAKNVANGHWYYVNKGAIQWNYTRVAKNPANGKWYYVQKGEINWNYIGLAKNPGNGNWYYVNKGMIDFSFTGIAKNEANGNYYYVNKGQLDWNFSGKYYDSRMKKTFTVTKGVAK